MFEGMTDEEYLSYQGVYQSYAWHQGWAGIPVKFRLPDENFAIGKWGSKGYKEGFDVLKFFRVVSDMDNEGAVHSWRLEEEQTEHGTERFLTLTCTEDDSQSHEDYNPDLFGHSDWWIQQITGGEG